MDYSTLVRRRFGAPARAGEFPKDAANVVTGVAEDRSLNVWVRFSVQSIDGEMRGLRYQVFGCPHAVAAADWLAEDLEGKTVEALSRIDLQAVVDALEIPREKLGKLLRIEDALIGCARQLDRLHGEKGIE